MAAISATLVHTERTARAMAAALAELLSGDQAAAVPIEARAWPGAERPLSANQEQMWLLHALAGASAYNMPESIELEEMPNLEALQAALHAVAGRHEVLRMHYCQQADESIEGVIAPAAGIRIPLEVAPAASMPAAAEGQLRAETAAAFELTAGPLIRAKLFERKAGGAVLCLTLHHAVGDAWSWSILHRELSEAYAAALAGKAPQWASLPIQYADYAAWQQEQLEGEEGAALRCWWAAALVGAPALLQLPLDRPRPAQPTNAAGQLLTKMPDTVLAGLQALARSLGVNMQAVLLAGLQALLLRYTGQDDVMVGVPVAGRDRPETHGLVGYFINTLPVRCAAEEDQSFAGLAQKASRATLDVLAHSLLPLTDILQAAGVQRMPGVSPLFQVLFQYLPPGEVAHLQLGGVAAVPLPVKGALAHAKLELTINITGAGMLSVDYMAELFDATTIERMVASYFTLLEAAVETPAAPINTLAMLSQADRQTLSGFSAGKSRPEYLAAPPFPAAFAALAGRQPGRPCLVFEGAEMSYGAVAQGAAALAATLAGMGVGRGSTVGIMLDRSFELIIAIIGVLQAGGQRAHG